jgi:rhamnose transport system permease protein
LPADGERNGSWIAAHERILALLVVVEILTFSIIGEHFLSWANAFEILRLGVEIGLLALALTPVIVTAGIDLSVGSLLGLSAVVFGWLWHDAGFSIPVAVILTLLLGLLGGAVNAFPSAVLGISPLIVTLGTYSLFRGLAEGLTGGIVSYSSFPASYLFLGQGYVWGVVPTQAFAFALAAFGYWVLLQRSVIGRALYAIGFSPAAARYAGIPVARRLGLGYVLSGFVASAAAIIYVSHAGQAKADAGTGYELMAITAVVLGGTSIFGGRGTIFGTVLGLLAIVVLQNGLRLSSLPAELAGILTGLLLVVTISIDQAHEKSKKRVRAAAVPGGEGLEVKNSQVAVLSAVILVNALIVAGSNWFLVNAIRDRGPGASSAKTAGAKIVIGMMPKAKGDPYFVSCRKGAEEAAAELGDELIWDGPTDLDPAKQNEVVEGWITRGVNVIAVSVENQAAISSVLRKARGRGIHVLTWDADSEPDARDFFINQATPQGIGYTLTDQAARLLHESGEFAIVTASLSAANQNQWIHFIRERLAQKYPRVKLATIRPSDGDRDRAFAETQTVLKVYPNVKVVMAIAAPAVPGAAEAVKQSRRTDVKVTGLSLPNMCKPYIHDGVIDSIVLWNTRDLAYMTVYAGDALAKGRLNPTDTALEAGRLHRIEVRGGQVMLGAPFVFNKTNIDQFDF